MSVDDWVDHDAFNTRLVEIFGDEYSTIKRALLAAERDSMGRAYPGLSELRDALEHLRRAYDQEEWDDAKIELEEGFEHLRRAGVESVQEVATQRYLNLRDQVESPHWVYRLSLMNLRDLGSIPHNLRDMQASLEEARKRKSDKEMWTESVDEYLNVIETARELESQIPPKSEASLQLLKWGGTLLLMILGIVIPLIL